MQKKIIRRRTSTIKSGDIISIRGGEAKVTDIAGPITEARLYNGEPFFYIRWQRYLTDGSLSYGKLERRGRSDINLVTYV